jgi:gamma-glutamylcyclotransferase (GGCT)/AIG2-like uncharacterized protein YtfP
MLPARLPSISSRCNPRGNDMANTDLTANADLKSMHGGLLALNQKLSNSLDDITDAAMARAVVTEMREIVHRIDLIQGLLFAASAKKISDAVKAVDQANEQALKSLDQIKTVTGVVRTVSGVLTLVDKAIDIAKTLAIA